MKQKEMGKTTLAVKIEYKVADRVRKFCRERGIKYGFFVEKALEERLERAVTIEDFTKAAINNPIRFAFTMGVDAARAVARKGG